MITAIGLNAGGAVTGDDKFGEQAAERFSLKGGVMQDVEPERFPRRELGEPGYCGCRTGARRSGTNDRSIGYARENRSHGHRRRTEFEILHRVPTEFSRPIHEEKECLRA